MFTLRLTLKLVSESAFCLASRGVHDKPGTFSFEKICHVFGEGSLAHETLCRNVVECGDGALSRDHVGRVLSRRLMCLELKDPAALR